MPSKVFLNIVADPAATSPTSLNLNLNNNGVTVNDLNGAYAVLFNRSDVGSLVGSTTNITITVGAIVVDIDVDNAYNTKQMAVQLKNGSSYLFTVNTGTTAQTSTFNGFDSVSPEKIRKWGQENGGGV